jgi:ABC-type transport system involved in multi-copper enzyme maturation permease subunit
MNLLQVEMRRALRRRVIRVLILIALGWCLFAGVIAFLSSNGKELSELHRHGALHPAVIADWWQVGKGDNAVTTAALFLLIGGFFAGAAVAGAEWRAGTVTTVLTWEPRRTRLNLTRTAACGICAFVIACILQAIFLASFLPAAFAGGFTGGTDPDWWVSLALAVARTSLVTAIAATLGVALATLGRNTAFALGAVFAWVAVIESMIRGLRPGWGQYLWGENLVTTVQWGQLEKVEFARGPLLALATVFAYTAVLVIAATIAFQRRDLAGST